MLGGGGRSGYWQRTGRHLVVPFLSFRHLRVGFKKGFWEGFRFELPFISNLFRIKTPGFFKSTAAVATSNSVFPFAIQYYEGLPRRGQARGTGATALTAPAPSRPAFVVELCVIFKNISTFLVRSTQIAI